MSGKIQVGNLTLIQPYWPVTKNIHAYSTTRIGGVSLPPFDTFNLGLSVEDDRLLVEENRRHLQQQLKLNQQPYWLQQTHSDIVIEATKEYKQQEADASFTKQKNVACAVMTADCLPILIAHKNSNEVAAIHAGWRSLLNGIIENTIDRLSDDPMNYYYWLGPAISQKAFEVGSEVLDMFINKHPISQAAFMASKREHYYYADIYHLAKIRLESKQIDPTLIYGGNRCTFTEKELFYSYRRDGVSSGRMASLIWIGN